MKYHAVFYEAFEEEEKALRMVLPGKWKYLFTWKTIQESGHKVPPAPVISTRTQSVFPPEWAKSLKGIITRSTGYDHVSAYLALTGEEIPSAYLPEYAARAVAEHALMMWAALLRNLGAQEDSFSGFHRDRLTGREIRNRRMTVVGVGRIGGEIVDIAHALGMDVRGVDIRPRAELKRKYGLRYLPLDRGLMRADVVAAALPLTDVTRGMLDYGALRGMPRGAVFINVGRGEVSPSADLLRLVDEGRLGGIGLDVFEHEKELASVLRDGAKLGSLPPAVRKSVSAALKLSRRGNVILTPHNAFNTVESVERKSLRTAENLESFLRKGAFLTPLPV